MEERHSVLTKDHGGDGRSSQKHEQELRSRTKGSAPILSHTGLPDDAYSTNAPFQMVLTAQMREGVVV